MLKTAGILAGQAGSVLAAGFGPIANLPAKWPMGLPAQIGDQTHRMMQPAATDCRCDHIPQPDGDLL